MMGIVTAELGCRAWQHRQVSWLHLLELSEIFKVAFSPGQVKVVGGVGSSLGWLSPGGWQCLSCL